MRKGHAFDYQNPGKYDNWDFSMDKSKSVDKKGSTQESFVNRALRELQIMHVVCSVLLFLSMLSCRNASGTAINFSSVLKIVSVPIYISVLMRAEQSIRKYRTVYVAEKESQIKNFEFANWKDGKLNGGSTCFFDRNGTGILWLWIELYAFMG
jgi:hypothetical protein